MRHLFLYFLEVMIIGFVKISKGNSKMGSIASVSLPAGETCRQCACHAKCYAAKIERLRPNVKAAYQNNLMVLQNTPEIYWREVEAALMTNRYFRFHVSGDIPDADYFENMVKVVKRNTHCEVLCFTKKFEIVNQYIFEQRDPPRLPLNLHIVFSGWPGLRMINGYGLPEAHVRFRDGTTTAREDAKLCGGNCTECAITGEGCWTLKRGEQIIFDEH